MTVEEIIKKDLGTIIDVRSYGEFMGGHSRLNKHCVK